EIYAFPDRLISKGKEAMRETYGQMFSQLPELHCRLDNRIVMGDTVIDHEYITGIPNQEPFSAIAIYKIAEDKIQQVYFIQ
ncbi:MAG: nuclear transport factor 2 family protein, partial [Bacteroidota bacterium]